MTKGGRIVLSYRDSADGKLRSEALDPLEFAFLISYSKFAPGSFIRDTGPSETIHFFAAEAVFQF